jgi:hypothetical protein
MGEPFSIAARRERVVWRRRVENRKSVLLHANDECGRTEEVDRRTERRTLRAKETRRDERRLFRLEVPTERVESY